MSDSRPRIFRVKYRSALVRRVATKYVKVPIYPVTEGLHALTDQLASKVLDGELLWFRIDLAKPAEIAAHREELSRWHSAMTETSATTKVSW